MENADKAVLRLGLGMGLSVAIAWGVGLEAAFMAPVMTVTLLAKPGPPIPLVKGAVLGFLVAGLLLAGVLTVPILKNYPVSGILVTSALFYTVTYTSARKANPLPRQGSPSTWTRPESGTLKPSKISTVVALPAPFGPSIPRHSPRHTSRSRPATATVSP